MHKAMHLNATKPEFWERVRTDAAYKPYVDEALRLYAEYKAEPILADSFAKFNLFNVTGDRAEFQRPYFRKRKRLNVCALLSMIFPENREYMESLEEIIWAICDEYTWSLPAHIAWAEDERTDIDLFASETGYALSEIVTVLADRINPRVYKRVCEGIQRRIIDSFEIRIYDWEKVNSNWAAVCAGSVSVVYMYMAPERFAAVKPRLQATIELFIDGFSDDGICYEGGSYWIYGFGFFVAYAQHLYDYTDGKENYFVREKVRRIADFEKITNLGGLRVNFSDSGGDCLLTSPTIYGVLQKHYPDMYIPQPETYEILDGCARWCRYFDAFLYLPVQKEAAPAAYEHYSPQAGWFMKRTNDYGFAAKAGTNDEPHNHNDIGSFIFAVGGEQILCDLGAGEYVKGYFAKATRYSYLSTCSRGHSVPIIDGKYQSPGAEFKGEMTYENGIVTIDMSDAY
ncbi:MAG: heparinase II/III family protein, partial [Clostridia bacterium]|nr:heparinase II/III family protein [Clostridia bacterium]